MCIRDRIEADADLERVLVIDDRDIPLTLADERIARAIRENNAKLVIIDPVQAFLGADVDMNRANEVRPIFRSLGDIAQATGCAIVLIGHLNKAAGTQSTYRGLGSIDITAAVRSLLFIGKLKDNPTTRVLIHEKSSLAPPGQSLAFSLGDEKGFEWIGAYDIMIEIYLVTSVAPVPMAAMMGKEWGGMGQNYLRSLLALGFQAFLIIVCVAIYAVLVQNIALEDDIIMAIWSCVGYTVLLCFTLFKTGSLAKSVFQAH